MTIETSSNLDYVVNEIQFNQTHKFMNSSGLFIKLNKIVNEENKPVIGLMKEPNRFEMPVLIPVMPEPTS